MPIWKSPSQPEEEPSRGSGQASFFGHRPVLFEVYPQMLPLFKFHSNALIMPLRNKRSCGRQNCIMHALTSIIFKAFPYSFSVACQPLCHMLAVPKSSAQERTLLFLDKTTTQRLEQTCFDIACNGPPIRPLRFRDTPRP